METASVAGKIHISETTDDRLRDQFALEARGAMDIKGKGSMRTWLLLCRKPSAAHVPLAPRVNPA